MFRRKTAQKMPFRHARNGARRRSAGYHVGLALFSVIAIVVAGGAVMAGKLAGNIKTVDITPVAGEEKTIPNYEGAFDVLLVGSDGRDGQGAEFGEGGDVEGMRNDTTMLLHVNQDHQSATVISFPRDLLVNFPECTNPETGQVYPAEDDVMFNTGMERGGLSCVAKVVTELTGYKIQYAAELTFQGAIALSNAVGGVPICFLGAIDDPDSGLKIPAAGTYDLQGDQALSFVRSRHGVGDGSDLGRISSQQLFLSSLVRKLQAEATFSDPIKLFHIADAITSNSVLSTDLASPKTLAAMAAVFSKLPLSSLTFVTLPYLPADQRVVPDWDRIEQLTAAINSGKPLQLDQSNLGRATEAVNTDDGAGTDGTENGDNAEQPSTDDTGTGSTGTGSTETGNTDTGNTDGTGDTGSDTGEEDSQPAPSLEGIDGQRADQDACVIPF